MMKQLIVCFFFIMNMAFGDEEKKESIKISAIDWCPQICPKDKINPGFLVEMINDLFKDSKFNISIEYEPWSRAIYNVERGYADALLSPSKEEAPGLIYHKENLSFQTHCFWKKKGSSWTFKNIDSLFHTKFVIYRDHPYSVLLNDYFQKHHADNHFEFTFDENYIDRAIVFLHKSRAQSFLDTANSVAYHLKHKGIETIERDACIKQEELWLGLSPKNIKKTERLRDFLDTNLLKYKESQRYRDLIEKYQISFPKLLKF